MPNRITSLVGLRFHELTVLSEADPFVSSGRTRRAWLCKCDCGTEKIIVGESLTGGNTKSCGCRRIREIKKQVGKSATHGHCRDFKVSPEYRSWSSMIQRCTNPNQKRYDRYGGRGIIVCERWMTFENFLTDMGYRPSMKHSIDRYPNKDGNYEPANCRWATQSEQNRNRAGNHFITVNDETLCLEDWAIRRNLVSTTILGRLKRGWTEEDAVMRPRGNRGKWKKSEIPTPGHH